jgi:hypothetical protein
MKCKDCKAVDCWYRTSDAEKECECPSHAIQVSDEWQYVRIQAAIAAMQSFIGKFNINIRDSADCEKITKLAVEQADALIEELKK